MSDIRTEVWNGHPIRFVETIDSINTAKHLLATVNELDKVKSLTHVKTELEDMRDRLIEGRESA